MSGIPGYSQPGGEGYSQQASPPPAYSAGQPPYPTLPETVFQQPMPGDGKQPLPATAPGSVPPPPPGYAPPPQGTTTTNVVYVNQIHMFGKDPVDMTCSNCHANIRTRVESSSSSSAFLLCAAFCLLGLWCGCCLIPFCMDGMQIHTHVCPNCRSIVGKSHHN